MDFDEKEILKRVNIILADYQQWNVWTFGDWLKRYDDTMDEVISFISEYMAKCFEERYDEIEDWMKVVMLNSVAIYMLEMDLYDVPPAGLRGKILFKFIDTIRLYKLQQMGLIKINSEITISEFKQIEFVTIEKE